MTDWSFLPRIWLVWIMILFFWWLSTIAYIHPISGILFAYSFHRLEITLNLLRTK